MPPLPTPWSGHGTKGRAGTCAACVMNPVVDKRHWGDDVHGQPSGRLTGNRQSVSVAPPATGLRDATYGALSWPASCRSSGMNLQVSEPMFQVPGVGALNMRKGISRYMQHRCSARLCSRQYLTSFELVSMGQLEGCVGSAAILAAVAYRWLLERAVCAIMRSPPKHTQAGMDEKAVATKEGLARQSSWAAAEANSSSNRTPPWASPCTFYLGAI